MKAVEKGSYGYIEARKKSQIIKSGIFFAIVAAIYYTGIIATGTRNNICTVIAILGVLPAAKFLVSYLVICKFKTPSKDKQDELARINGAFVLYSDCAMSCKDKIIYAEFAAVTDNVIYCYTDNRKFNAAYFEREVAEFIKSCGDTVQVKLFVDFAGFSQRLNALKNVEFKQNKMERVAQDFKILLL